MNIQNFAHCLQVPFDFIVEGIQANKEVRYGFALSIITTIGLSLAFYDKQAALSVGMFAFPLNMQFGPVVLGVLAVNALAICGGKFLGCCINCIL